MHTLKLDASDQKPKAESEQQPYISVTAFFQTDHIV